MKKVLIFILISLFFLQYSFLTILNPNFFAGPGLLLLFAIGVFLKTNFNSSILWAFFVGVLLDYFSSLPIGTNIIFLLVVAGIVQLYKTKLEQSKNRYYIAAMSMFVGLVLFDLYLFCVMKLNFVGKIYEGALFVSGQNTQQYFFPKLVFSIFGIAIFYLVDKTFKYYNSNFNEIKLDK